MRDETVFKQFLSTIWFGRWSKYVAGVVASSGWEHVNIFERLENNVIVGFHSWIYLFNEEQDGNFNYLGYIQTLDTGLSFQFPSICTAAPSRPLNRMLAPVRNWIWQLELCATSHVPTFLASSKVQTESSTPGKRVPSLTMESSTSRAPIRFSNQRKLWREI